MARSKLITALERHKGIDKKKELQKKHMKDVDKLKRKREEEDEEEDESGDSERDEEEEAELELEDEDDSDLEDEKAAALADELDAELGVDLAESEFESEDDDEDEGGIDISRLNESDSDSADEEDDEQDLAAAKALAATSNPSDEDDEDDEDEEEDDIPLSDLDSNPEETADLIPHQRLTINNTAALTRSLASIALPPSLPFNEFMTTTSTEQTHIPDINDDLNREASFYAQALEAARKGRAALRAQGIPFTRPTDYFAEMVKSDEHMGKVKSKLIDEAAGKKAAQEARAQRDLKKFGKQVQQEKLKERAKAKKEMLENVKALKRKRQAGGGLQTATEEDMFDVALEDAAETERKDRAERRAKGGAAGGRGKTAARAKRESKDKKYGFGGKKRFAKSGDAQSSADMRGFSKTRAKAGSKARPGKSKRRKMNM